MTSKINNNYLERHARQMGIMSRDQLLEIRGMPVAIGGLGLGGSVFINLVRLGFERFHIADPDIYERSNIGRQRAAKETTVGRRKDEALIEEARAINPDLKVVTFPDGVQETNVDRFLKGVRIVVDAVDVFAIPEKIALHEAARAKGLLTVTCSTAGFGASVVVFDAKSPSFVELSGLSKTAEYAQNMDRWVKF
ncbi:MAG TPA: ThiF family adenylyltransferase, partial [Bdellovibrionota bacterium]|nr:ThiF family adenylyltransferase [Bdellovibrionota bacterium]